MGRRRSVPVAGIERLWIGNPRKIIVADLNHAWRDTLPAGHSTTTSSYSATTASSAAKPTYCILGGCLNASWT
jgi:hypothetical protein